MTKLFVILMSLAVSAGPWAAEAADPKLKVGILHLGSVTDGGYNQAHAEGIAVMKKNLPRSRSSRSRTCRRARTPSA
jgi:basic membrane lipoprotein Med (substrate-binding protein (PBP1-ABC) superfamily)